MQPWTSWILAIVFFSRMLQILSAGSPCSAMLALPWTLILAPSCADMKGQDKETYPSNHQTISNHSRNKIATTWIATFTESLKVQ
jgi:hypothetical protein